MNTRTQNTIRNSKIGIVKFLFQLIFQFVIRTILIYTLGKEYIGLSGLFTNIIGLLNLAELGIGSAIVFSMYKPIAENDEKTIGQLLYFYKKCYFWIALTVSCIGVILIPFLPKLANGGYPSDVNIYLVYISYLLNTIISYFMAHKRALLFANQRNDIENKVKTICIFGLNITQIILLLVFKSYNIYILVLPIFTILESLLIHFEANRLFKIKENSEKLNPEIKSEIKKNVVAMSMHQIGGVCVTSTDNLLLSIIFGLTAVGVYNNYNLVITSIISIISLLISATQASVGNKMASDTPNEVYQNFKIINSLFIVFIGWCSICMLCLFQDFILAWTRESDYLLDFYTVFIIVLSFYTKESLGVTYMFKNAAGLMWYDKISPIIQSISNLLISIILCKLLGLIGIFIGTILSTILGPFWLTPRTLFKNYFKVSQNEYYKNYFLITFITIITGAVTFFICKIITGGLILKIIIKALICVIVPLALYTLFYFKTPEFKYFVTFVKNFLSKRKRL